MPALERGLNTNAMDIFVNRLAQLGPISNDDRAMLRQTPLAVREVRGDHELLTEGHAPTYCPFLLEGFACRYKVLSDGQRQIVAFHLAGDLCDLTSLAGQKLNHSTLTLTPARLIPIPYSAILNWGKRSPDFSRLLWRAALIDIAISNEWITNIGRRIAQRRIAHLFCEMIERMRRNSQTTDGPFVLPLTQVVLADALGLTAVHVNRTLQWLRNEQLIEFSGGILTVHNWRELVRMAAFDPKYLQ